MKLHRPDTSVKGVAFPGERQREPEDVPCASSPHTIKLFPYYPCSSLTSQSFYLGQKFYHPLPYMTARKSISVTPTDSEALKPSKDCLAALSQRSHSALVLAAPGLCPTPGSKAVLAAAFQQQHRDSSEQSSDRSWGHLAQSCA